MSELCALSFLQPWLWAILEGYKGFRIDGQFYAVENRPWKPWPKVVGERIALHASLGYDDEGADFIDEQLILAMDPQRSARYRESPPKTGCARGAILGTAKVLGAMRLAGQQEWLGSLGPAQANRATASPWSFGPWVWLLTDLQKLPTPVPCKGAFGLWRVPPGVIELVVDAARAGGAG